MRKKDKGLERAEVEVAWCKAYSGLADTIKALNEAIGAGQKDPKPPKRPAVDGCIT
jgi:hypothetical protein